MAAWQRVSEDGMTTKRDTARRQFNACAEWAKTHHVPPEYAMAAWMAAHEYWSPEKDWDAISSFQKHLGAKFRAEEDLDFASIEDERITRENLAVAINEDPDHPVVKRVLKKLMDTSLKLSFNPKTTTEAYYQRRITNQNGVHHEGGEAD